MKRLLLPALGSLLLATTAAAQFELKGGSFNSLRAVPVNTGGTPAVFTPQYSGQAATTGSAGAIDTTPGNPLDAGSIAAEHYNRYPAGKQTSGVTVVGGIVLIRSSIGGVFASGVPRYFLGDEIERPLVASTGIGVVAPGYWRAKPVAYDEIITHPGGGQVTPLPNPNDPAPAPAHSFYYSPHAGKVFAHQPGRVTVMWVTQAPVGQGGTTGVGDNPKLFRFKEESFSVSSGTSRPVRTIYWTERTFNGPAVTIPTGRIVTVNPVFNTFFPQNVDEEYAGVGVIPGNPNATPATELRTLWFQNTAGLGQLRAYNKEGRILVEYLGTLQSGGGAVHEFLGADIVEVVQAAPSIVTTVKLGEQLLPRDFNGQVPDNADTLRPTAVMNLGQNGVTYYGTSARADGQLIYHAEWENDNPDRVSFYWLEENDAAIHFLAAPGTPNLGIAWPKYLNKYRQVWPGPISEYAGVSVEDNGSTAATGLQLSGGSLPTIVHQDDGAQTEAEIDQATQRLVVDFSASTDKTNRSLLKFSTGSSVWYVRLFIQSQSVLGSPEIPDPDGAGPLTGTPAVYTLADLDANGTRDLVVTTAIVGQRIERPDSNHEIAGFIAAGKGYHPGAYVNPFLAGVPAAAAGAIIPVNAKPGDDQLTVWWFTKVTPPGNGFEPFYVPSKSGVYTVSYPSGADQIIMASNAGTGDISPAQAAGELYYQNNAALPGYNPNEEHALKLSGRAYALRDDLNVTSGGGFTSQPFVLISYTNPTDNRPAMRVFQVLRELDLPGTANDVLFNYPVTAGARIPAPMPLPLLPLPVDANGNMPNREVVVTPDPAPHATAPDAYDAFTYKDRKDFIWVYRGPHNAGTPTLGMQFYYMMQEGFFIPGVGTQPAVGTVLPYLRPLSGGVPQGDAVTGTPLTVIYRPTWPTAAPELRVAETLALPKFGLPQVRGQTSAEVLYQQSIALNGTTKDSVTLHDPTVAKKVLLSSQGLDDLPASIATTIYNGRTYFQRLPPHLQQRFYMTPVLGGDLELVLEGQFIDEPAGEDYLNLNVLSATDVTKLKELASDDPGNKWSNAIDALKAKVDTFIENTAKKGTYKIGSSTDVNGTSLVKISDSDTAVDSYALTATGQGTGYVTLLFADGEAFTPEGDPISLAVIKVAPQLYVGDMKVLFSSNPLDEQVSLRHSGDFAARPQDYEFEWRYSPLVDGLPPATYAYNAPTAVLSNATTWKLVQNPAAALPSAAEYTAAATVPVPRTLTIYNESYASGELPGVVMKSTTDVDFTAALPAQVIFSTDLSNDLDGFVLHVNGIPVLAFRAPESFTSSNAVTGLSSTGLPQQFSLSPNFFTKGVNTIEVALFSDADPLVSSQVNFRLETVTRNDRVDPAEYAGSPWLQPNGTLLNLITLGGSPTAPLGDPVLLMQDNAFTVRYRPKIGIGHILAPGADQSAVPWSDWMDAQPVPGWVKRVLAAINPFNQRMTDLYNNAVNTDVSVLTQAGTRWEGDIALNLENINSAGLIEIYETVLNRAKLFSIDNGYDVPGVNDALMLAAGYLNDLYILLGNEAYADAANPTISLDDQTTITEVNTSRFSFEGQVASALEEELALLRGRDDFLATSVATAPAYNRLYWNYTGGINSGEVLYAVNYNIKEKAGSSTQNGIINAADAQRMFPQAHGDAYGHYLTALKGYYRLLTHEDFTWTPRAEVVLVLGQNVSVDYYDERKFAAAAANVARSAEQILALTWRQAYQDDKATGWTHFRDNKLNSRTNERRQWGVDEWAARGTGGAYLHWLSGNAVLPDEDNNPQHSGIQIVDRSTVPELVELAAAGASMQETLDHANAHLNPLGLSPDAITFDISPSELKAGNTHFEQVYGRALSAVLNAKGAFDQAGRMTRLLRNQDNQIDDYNTTIEEQERAFDYKLIDLFGTPYTADVGPGKTYAQGYDGPDLIHWFLVDEASDLVDAYGPARTISVKQPMNFDPSLKVSGADLDETASFNTIYNQLNDPALYVTREVAVKPNRLAQKANIYLGGTAGERRVTGELQTALLLAQEAQIELQGSLDSVGRYMKRFHASRDLFAEMVRIQSAILSKRTSSQATIIAADKLQKTLESSAREADAIAAAANEIATGISEAFPKMLGFSNDVSSGPRSITILAGVAIAQVARFIGVAQATEAAREETKILEANLLLEKDLDALGFDLEQRQFIYEFYLLFNEVVDQTFDVAARAGQYQRANEEIRNVLARGDRILAEREIFRLRAAAIIQGYRTRDVAFRAFRNEALEQYRTLYDLGARYTYLAAKSYDYETGLLGSPAGRAVINRIVASRALGDLNNGIPQATVSTLGDAGLAGTMAQMTADFAVAKGRLGINNPDQNGTLFSLRHELFRLTEDPTTTADDDQWQQTLEQHIVSDLMTDPDAAIYCNSLSNSNGGRVRGIIIPFSTTVRDGHNWFGLPTAGGDHAYSESNFATKIYSAGMVLKGYVGMDPYAFGTPNAGGPTTSGSNTLSATPYVYLIPTGIDSMRAPALGTTGSIRSWDVVDQALPLPYNLGATAFNGTQFFNASGTLTEKPWIARQHQAFRPVNDPAFFYSLIPQEFTSSRLVGRSVWNRGWKIVIPAYTLLNNEEDGLNRFVRSVKDIQLFLRTYSHSGN